MADLSSLLLGTLRDDKSYLAESPMMQSARSVMDFEFPANPNGRPYSNTDAFLMPLAKGILSGVLMNQANEQARQQAYEDASASPILKILRNETNVGPLADGTEFVDKLGMANSGIAEVLKAYGAETAPEGWNANQGRQDLLTLALQRSEEAEKAKVRQDLANKLQELEAKNLFERGPAAIKFEEEKARAAAAGKAAGEGVSPNFEKQDALRKEFSGLPEVKDFSNVMRSADALTKAIEDKSSVSDQELVRRAIQMIEPGMAVREGEQKAVGLSQSIPEAWKGELDKALTGGTALSDDVRAGIKRIAKRAYDAQAKTYEKTRKFYEEQATKRGFDPRAISYLGAAPDSAKFFGDVTGMTGVSGSWSDASWIPPGMKRVRNLATGEVKDVPIDE